MTAPMVDYKIHWLKMMSVPESRAVVGRHDGKNGRDTRAYESIGLHNAPTGPASRRLLAALTSTSSPATQRAAETKPAPTSTPILSVRAIPKGGYLEYIPCCDFLLDLLSCLIHIVERRWRMLSLTQAMTNGTYLAPSFRATPPIAFLWARTTRARLALLIQSFLHIGIRQMLTLFFRCSPSRQPARHFVAKVGN